MPRDPPGAPPFPFPIPEAADTPAAPLLFLSLLFVQGAGAAAGMDLSRVGEKLLSSVRSARSLGLLPPPAPDRPEVPARAAAAAAVARVIAGLPPHQRLNFPSDSAELATVYGSRSEGQIIEELEEGFYEEDFDPIKYVLENIPSEDNDANFFENKATVRLAQLDKITERLSRHVMEHHEEMVKGMQLVMELEQDLKVANVICMNGRRYIASSMQEVSRDLVVNSYSKKKQALLDMIPILTELRHALDMQMALDSLVDDGKYFRAFQVLSEYLQVLDNYSDLSAIQEMGHGIEAWLARTLQKLDALLLGVCQSFMEENYVTVVDAYALIGDVSGLAEKIQSFFMQEVLSETHSVLRDLVHEELGNDVQRNRLTYSDLCIQIPESKFRQCLLRTLAALFKLMCSYYAIMSFQPHEKDPDPNTPYSENQELKISQGQKDEKVPDLGLEVSSESNVQSDFRSEQKIYVSPSSLEAVVSSNDCNGDVAENLHSQTSTSDDNTGASSSASPFYQLRKDAMSFVSQALQRGKKNLWQLITSRVSMLLSCSAVCSTSTYQFLKNYEDLSVFILAGEAFCGVEAVEFRQRLKIVCENYVLAFHRQNIYAFKMVLEKESWVKMTADALHVINLAGLTGDGAPLIVPSDSNNSTLSLLHTKKISKPVNPGKPKNGFSSWLKIENPFSLKLTSGSKESPTANTSLNRSTISSLADGNADLLHHDKMSSGNHPGSHVNGSNSLLEDENEDLLADFIDEDSQLPSRISNRIHRKTDSGHSNDEEIAAQTGSSLCLLRIMDKYARIMQKLEIVNVEFFKGICQLFGIFYHFIFETFGQRETSQARLRTTIMKIMQDCDQWIRPQNLTSSSLSSASMNISFTQMDVMPTIPSSTLFAHVPSTLFGLKERCTAAETISLVAHVLHRSKVHLQSMLLQHNTAIIEDFYGNLVDSVPDLCEYIHRTTARMLLHINGYADKIANAKWEVKELGLEHNGYVDLLLGEYKHYKTLLAHGGISKEVQELLLDYGLENVAEILIEGLSRVKRCTDEGRVLMSLDLQVLINGLQHFVSINVKPKLQVVETFIKAYYLPETEYVYWARAHPEYSKSQIVGLVNLVATMKGWKRKTRLETLERIEAGN